MPGLTLLSNIPMYFRKRDRSPNISGFLKFYENKDYNTKKSAYVDYGSAVKLDNPYQLDGAGFAADPIWLGEGAYSMEVLDSSLNQIWMIDNINITGDITIPDRLNLLDNGSFEVDDDDDGVPNEFTITTYTGGVVQRVTDQHQHGAACMYFYSTGSGGGYFDSSSYFEVSPLIDYEMLFELIANTGGATIRNKVEVFWFKEDLTASAVRTSDTIYDNEIDNPTAWTRKYGVVTPPSDARYMKYRGTGGDPSNSNVGKVWMDNFIFRPVTPAGLAQELGDMFYANGALSLARLPAGVPGQALRFEANGPVWTNSAEDAAAKLYLYNNFK